MQLDDVTALGGEPTRNRDLRSRGRQTIARLLRAGQEVVEERGHDQARVDDIVKRAGVSHGTFYLYFKDRDDLLSSLIKLVSRQLVQLGDELPTTPDAASLAGWILRSIEVFDVHAEVLRAARSMCSDEAVSGLVPAIAKALDNIDGASKNTTLVAEMLLCHLERATVRDDIVDADALATVTLRAAAGC